MAEAGWRIDGPTIRVDALVPPNTTAIVVLPGVAGAPIEVGAGRHEWIVEGGVYRSAT